MDVFLPLYGCSAFTNEKNANSGIKDHIRVKIYERLSAEVNSGKVKKKWYPNAWKENDH
jgi:hypothetical protein